MRRGAWRLLLAAVILHASARAEAADSPVVGRDASRPHRSGLFGQLELDLTILSYLEDPANLFASTGAGIAAGYRVGRWAPFLRVDRHGWSAGDGATKTRYTTLNFAPGLEVCFFACRASAAVAVGFTVLCEGAPGDHAGEVGAFADIRPASFRWPVHRRLWLVITPLSFVFLIPSLERIPLVTVEFRTTLTVELAL